MNFRLRLRSAFTRRVAVGHPPARAKQLLFQPISSGRMFRISDRGRNGHLHQIAIPGGSWKIDKDLNGEPVRLYPRATPTPAVTSTFRAIREFGTADTATALLIRALQDAGARDSSYSFRDKET